MAQSLQIHMDGTTGKILLDGHEITDVIAYKLEECLDQLPEIELRIAITGAVEVQKQSLSL